MKVRCVWEHNGEDSLLYAADYAGAFTRGENAATAIKKMRSEIRSYFCWRGLLPPQELEIEISQENASELNIADADSDVLMDTEIAPLTASEYYQLKALALKSAADFQNLFDAVPDKDRSCLPERTTFYGPVPRTAREMYDHTKSVNAYYFGEIGVSAHNTGTILECRERGFAALEAQADFLLNPVFDGSYGECWSLRKVLRRFIWHDRIHAKAMYRMAISTFGTGSVPDVFCFE